MIQHVKTISSMWDSVKKAEVPLQCLRIQIRSYECRRMIGCRIGASSVEPAPPSARKVSCLDKWETRYLTRQAMETWTWEVMWRPGACRGDLHVGPWFWNRARRALKLHWQKQSFFRTFFYFLQFFWTVLSVSNSGTLVDELSNLSNSNIVSVGKAHTLFIPDDNRPRETLCPEQRMVYVQLLWLDSNQWRKGGKLICSHFQRYPTLQMLGLEFLQLGLWPSLLQPPDSVEQCREHPEPL